MDQRIDLQPEELYRIAGEFHKAFQNGQTVIQQLHTVINQSDGQWEGARQQEFYQRIHESLSSVNTYLQGLHSTGTQLQHTASRIQNADQHR